VPGTGRRPNLAIWIVATAGAHVASSWRTSTTPTRLPGSPRSTVHARRARPPYPGLARDPALECPRMSRPSSQHYWLRWLRRRRPKPNSRSSGRWLTEWRWLQVTDPVVGAEVCDPVGNWAGAVAAEGAHFAAMRELSPPGGAPGRAARRASHLAGLFGSLRLAQPLLPAKCSRSPPSWPRPAVVSASWVLR
jgi:hypothetical protein